jgi:ferrous iron transport protein B
VSAHCSGTEPVAQRVAAAPGEETRPLVLLVGRPNSGKSSLFNRVTGGSAHVGNFPGVTVDILEADVTLPGGAPAVVADLPGLYALDALTDPTTDEGVARAFVEQAESSGRPVLLVQVIDGTQLSLGLRLTRELVRRKAPLLLVITQRDVLDAEGRRCDAEALRRAVGAPVVVVSSREPEARATVLAAVERALAGETRPPPSAWSPDEVGARVLAEAPSAGEEEARRRSRTSRVDAWLLHPALGPLAFLAITTAVFAAVFLIADPVSGALDALTGALGARITAKLGDGLFSSFLTAGVLGGAGTVLAFMPQIVILTIALELLEATGYLARGAFLVDRLLRLFGLSGRAFFPLLMGHACAVPAVTATRIIRDPGERLTTILVIPLMTCSARIPTYALLLGAFFAHRSPLFRSALFVGLYFAGILSGAAASAVLRRSATSGRSLPLVLEMPSYRAPQARVVARKAGRAAWRFFRDVGTTILVVAIALWALLTVPLPWGAPPAEPPAVTATADGKPAGDAKPAEKAEPRPIERSIAAGVGRVIEPVTRPLGFDWRINVGLIGSFGARELMVGTMGVIFGIENAGNDAAPLSQRMREARKADGSPLYGTRTCLALLAFFVLACQCMSTVAAIRRETKTWRWPAFVLGYTYVLAYAAAFLVYQVAGALGAS